MSQIDSKSTGPVDFDLLTYEFVGYGSSVVAVIYSGQGSRFCDTSNRRIADLTRTDKFKDGSPIYTSDFGPVVSITYRKRKAIHEAEDDEQDVIAAFGDGFGSYAALRELIVPSFGVRTGRVLQGLEVRDPIVVGDYPIQMLPVFEKSKGTFPYQDEKKKPGNLLIASELPTACKVIDRHFPGKVIEILPKEGRWKRGYSPSGFDVDRNKQKIYALCEGKKPIDLTDPLHAADVDIERTVQHIDEFGFWRKSDGPF